MPTCLAHFLLMHVPCHAKLSIIILLGTRVPSAREGAQQTIFKFMSISLDIGCIVWSNVYVRWLRDPMRKIAFGLLLALAFAHGARAAYAVELPVVNDAIAAVNI